MMKKLASILVLIALVGLYVPSVSQAIPLLDHDDSDPALQLPAAAAELVNLSSQTLRAALYSSGPGGDGQGSYQLVRGLYMFRSHSRSLSHLVSGGVSHPGLVQRKVAKLEQIAGRVDSVLGGGSGTPELDHDGHGTVAELWAKTKDAFARVKTLLPPDDSSGGGQP